MADLAASNVTITPQATAGAPGKARYEGNHRKVLAKIEFGDGALTYPAGGVPMPTYTSFGMQRSLSYLTIVDQDDNTGIIWKYDFANKKLRGWRSAGFTPAGTNSAPTLTVTGGQGAGVALQIDTDANAAVIGKTTATTRTGITGIQAPTFTGTAVAAGSLVEISGAVAAQTLYVEAVGW